MIKQDFYIANLIARYLSEEITPEETIKLTSWDISASVIISFDSFFHFFPSE